MSQLYIIYDPTNTLILTSDIVKALGLKEAMLSIPNDLENNDIYTIAKKLAELLLEQL